MRILVFGASGATGVHLVHKALAEGHHVTAFVRNAQKLRFQHPKLNIITGDVTAYEAVQQAVKGQDAVFSSLGAHSIVKLDRAIIDGISNIIQAMTTLKVARIIYLSTLGVQSTRQRSGKLITLLAPTILRNEIAGHEIREKIIQDSELQWSIVRAPILTNGDLTGRYQSGENLKSESFAPKLSRADVADCMMSMLTDDQSIRKSLMLLPYESTSRKFEDL